MEEDRHKIITAYNQELYLIYKENGLVCLSDNNYQLNGINILAINNPAVAMAVETGLIMRLHEVCDKLSIDYQVKNPNTMQDEIFVASADIKFRTGTLYLYHPYIVNLSASWAWFKGQKHYTYSQTMEDARFNRELPIAFESLYKFWQRIADYLCAFFPELLLKQKGQIYFQIPFLHIASQYPNLAISENFKWLHEFLTHKYPAFNKYRKFFVHYSGYDTDYFNKFLDSNGEDEAAVNALDNEREDWLPYLKEQLNLCNEGYIRLMNFLNELNIIKNADGKFEYALAADNAEVTIITAN